MQEARETQDKELSNCRDKQEFDAWVDDMDQAFPDGKYCEASGSSPRIRFKDMDRYCKQNRKNPTELTEEEMKPFRY